MHTEPRPRKAAELDALMALEDKEFLAAYDALVPGWREEIYDDFAWGGKKVHQSGIYDYSLAYAIARQEGLRHEDAVLRAEAVAKGWPEPVDRPVGGESPENRRMKFLPLSSPLPQVAAVVDAAPKATPDAQEAVARESAHRPMARRGRMAGEQMEILAALLGSAALTGLALSAAEGMAPR